MAIIYTLIGLFFIILGILYINDKIKKSREQYNTYSKLLSIIIILMGLFSFIIGFYI